MPASSAAVPPDVLRIGHSPDPDDLFMWWPITGMLAPNPPHGPTTGPTIDTGGFVYRGVPADIEVLNRRAIETGDLEITALSFGSYARVHERYALTACGSSMGHGYGPKVIARKDSHLHAGNLRESLLKGGATLAIPGERTTAFLVFSMMVGLKPGGVDGHVSTVEMPFDRVIPEVSAGRVDAGIVIHQGQVMLDGLGLREVVDLGAWWLERTGLALPLGANALRRDLETRHGQGTLAKIAGTLSASIRHALAHRSASLDYVLEWAPEMSRAQAERYIDMYVSALTVDAGDAGQDAVRRLMEEGAALGRLPRVPPVEFVRAG
jgi:1,4-dihydroxy-6-naphthoate synthase